MRIYQSVFVAVFVVFFLILASCAHMAVRDEVVPLEKRVASFWEAKVQGDWEGAYGFLCSAFRAQTTREDFVRSADLRILSFKVEAIDLQHGDKKAVVTVSFDTTAMGFELKEIKIKDEWVNENGAWRICPRPGGFKGIFEKK